jgi:hypothetical protein
MRHDNSGTVCFWLSLMLCFSTAASLTAQQESNQGSAIGVRIVNDPASACWVLQRTSSDKAGPGHWVQLSPIACRESPSRVSTDVHAPLPFVIQTGSRLVIEQHTQTVDARLLAQAMGPARMGQTVQVRLIPTGAVLLVVVTGPSRAGFAARVGEKQ